MDIEIIYVNDYMICRKSNLKIGYIHYNDYAEISGFKDGKFLKDVFKYYNLKYYDFSYNGHICTHFKGNYYDLIDMLNFLESYKICKKLRGDVI